MTEINQKRVIYIDSNGFPWWASWTPLLASIAAQGYNTVIFAFYLGTGATDAASTWSTAANGLNVTPTAAGSFSTTVPPGMKLLVSAGGSNFYMSSADPTVFGTAVGTWAANNLMDGIDFDIENLTTGSSTDDPWPAYIAWLSTSTIAAYNTYKSITNKVPIITHAPQGPYFGPVGGSLWVGPTGGYTGLEKAIGQYISWYNIQFYNQGGTCYTTTTGLTTKSASDCPVFAGTSINEIISYGIPANKIVVGKPLSTYGTTGFMSNLAGALNGISYGGIMGWQWDTTSATSCATLLGQACPNGAAPSGFDCTTCPPYQCNTGSTACINPCNTNSDCVSGYTCGSSGVCTQTPAFNCNTCSPYQCNTGSTACINPCSTNSDCVTGYTCGSSGVCTQTPAFNCNTCSPYQCNTGSTACINPCSTNSDCVTGYTCGSSGVCTQTPAFNCNTCSPYQCNTGSTACINPCSTNSDCVTGYTCGSSGVCTQTPAPSGFDCTTCPPYQCNTGSTACINPCNTNSDCVSGYTCGGGVCTKKAAPPGSSKASSSSTWIIIFVLIVVLATFGFYLYGRKKPNPQNIYNKTEVTTDLQQSN